MDRYTMFLDCKNQYCENDYTTQSNLQIQYHPYQIINYLYHRTIAKIFTICIEAQKTSNSQSNIQKEKQSFGNQTSCLQTILQSYSFKTVWYQHKKRHKDQWKKGRKSPETDPCIFGHRIFGHLIFDKGGKNIQWRKNSFFNEWCG